MPTTREPATAGPAEVPALQLSHAELAAVVASSSSYSQVLTSTGKAVSGNSVAALRRRVEAAGIDTSHFTRAKLPTSSKRKSAEEILVLRPPGSARGERTQLLRALREIGVPEECAGCGISEWYGKPLTLHIDHINENRLDDRAENLQLLCPNCHSVKTLDPHTLAKHRYRGAAVRTCLGCDATLLDRPGSRKTCNDCWHDPEIRARIMSAANRDRPRQKKTKWPPVTVLLAELENNTYATVCARYGGTDAGLRKHLASQGVTPPKKGRGCKTHRPVPGVLNGVPTGVPAAVS